MAGRDETPEQGDETRNELQIQPTSARLTENAMRGKSARKRLTGILAVCLRELMDELGVEPAWLPESRSRVELSEILAASVGFDGENLRGTFTLTGHPRVFTRLYPFAMEHAQPDLVDWAKELANQTIGRFKNRIFAYGLALSVSVPQSIPAEQLRVARTRKRIKIPVAIGIDDMSLDTWLELDIGPGFKLAEQPVSVNEPALPERSLVLFLEADNTQ